MEEYKLFQFFVDCGRMGDIDGLFIACHSDVNEIMGKRIYFGEILGKHSEVEVVIKPDNVTVISTDQDKIIWLKELLGTSVSGYNPLEYYESDGNEDEEYEE